MGNPGQDREPVAHEEPSVGRIVHFRASAEADCQAAIVVRIWSAKLVNLVVFRDGSNDDRNDHGSGELTSWRTSIKYEAEDDIQGTSWHWPERV